MSTSQPTLAPAPCREIAFRTGERDERIAVAIARASDSTHALDTADAWLAPVESQRIARAVPKRRQEFILGRFAAKTALARWNRQPALTDFVVTNGAFDQPVVMGGSAGDVTLAHTSDVAIAIAHERGHPMGVDVELIDRARIEIVRTQVSPAELPAANGPMSDEAARLFMLWSAKEALSKALRCGLTCPFGVLAAAQARISAGGICTGTFANFSQYQFVAWVAGNLSLAFVCSRDGEIGRMTEEVVRFAIERVGFDVR